MLYKILHLLVQEEKNNFNNFCFCEEIWTFFNSTSEQ